MTQGWALFTQLLKPPLLQHSTRLLAGPDPPAQGLISLSPEVQSGEPPSRAYTLPCLDLSRVLNLLDSVHSDSPVQSTLISSRKKTEVVGRSEGSVVKSTWVQIPAPTRQLTAAVPVLGELMLFSDLCGSHAFGAQMFSLGEREVTAQ